MEGEQNIKYQKVYSLYAKSDFGDNVLERLS